MGRTTRNTTRGRSVTGAKRNAPAPVRRDEPTERGGGMWDDALGADLTSEDVDNIKAGGSDPAS